MNCHISLRNGIVYMPTMGKMSKGFYRGVEPVAVVAAENTEALRQALNGTIARGNPAVPQPQRRQDWPPPVVLKYAGVKSWSAFERGRRVWDINEKDGVFQIAGNIRGLNGWVEDPKQTITFPPGTSVDSVIDRMIAILHDAARKQS
jgi:hypothetical protein